MDVARLDRGLQIAGGAGILLFISLFLPWYGLKLDGKSIDFPGSGASADAWQAFSYTDLLLFLVCVVAVGAAAATAANRLPALPVPLGRIILGAGVLAVLLVLFRLLDTPGPGGGDLLGVHVSLSRKLGIFVGLIGAGGIAYAGTLLDKGVAYRPPVR